jgi:ParB family chromosome partitioning protein
MSAEPVSREVHSIPIELIEVLNPRERNTRAFSEIIANIKTIGLKKPIVVTPRPATDGKERYLLICGEGRMKAFRSLGESSIPALVVAVTDEDAFIMSLSENIARRQWRPLELLSGIEELRDRGYNAKQIASKTGLTYKYVQGMLTLCQQGEQRLLVAVEKGDIPLNAALTIVGAGDDNKAVQAALQDAYEAGTLRGRRLIDARRVLERRASLGRSIARGTPRKLPEVTTSSLVRNYQKEVGRQQLLVRKAGFVQQRLLFVVGALKELFRDENFINLLRAEGLDTLPKYLAERVWSEGRRA